MRSRYFAPLAFFWFFSAASAQNVTVVQSKGPGAWGNRLRLVEELRIGEVEGAEEYTFGFIVDIGVGKDGNIDRAYKPSVLAQGIGW